MLDTRIVEDCTAAGVCEGSLSKSPTAIAAAFSQRWYWSLHGTRRYFVTLGQFSLVRMGRDTQLLIPPTTTASRNPECGGGDRRILRVIQNVCFPMNRVLPPNTVEMPLRIITEHAATAPAAEQAKTDGRNSIGFCFIRLRYTFRGKSCILKYIKI